VIPSLSALHLRTFHSASHSNPDMTLIHSIPLANPLRSASRSRPQPSTYIPLLQTFGLTSLLRSLQPPQTLAVLTRSPPGPAPTSPSAVRQTQRNHDLEHTNPCYHPWTARPSSLAFRPRPGARASGFRRGPGRRSMPTHEVHYEKISTADREREA